MKTLTLSKINCEHCNEEIPQHYDRLKRFCNATCNNENFNFINKLLPSIQDPILKQTLEKHLQNKVPTILLANLVRNHKKEAEKSMTKPKYSSHLACFYKNMILNLNDIIETKSVFMVKQQIAA